MKDRDKYIKLISKLNRLTKEDKISWEKARPPFSLSTSTNDVWISFYKTYYANTSLGLGEVRYQSYSDDYDQFYWAERVVWVLLDNNGDLQYEFPFIEGLSNLLETIRRTTADVDGTIEHLINAPEDEE